MLKTTFSMDGFSRQERDDIVQAFKDFSEELKKISDKSKKDISIATYIADPANMHTQTAKNIRNSIDAPYVLKVDENSILREDTETVKNKIDSLKKYQELTMEANKIVIEAKKKRGNRNNKKIKDK